LPLLSLQDLMPTVMQSTSTLFVAEDDEVNAGLDAPDHHHRRQE
jgi:hypothetical protein